MFDDENYGDRNGVEHAALKRRNLEELYNNYHIFCTYSQNQFEKKTWIVNISICWYDKVQLTNKVSLAELNEFAFGKLLKSILFFSNGNNGFTTVKS